jgi:hypothetical protein
VPGWTRWWREKFPAPAGTRTPAHPFRSPLLYHWAIPAPHLKHFFNSAPRHEGVLGKWRYSSTHSLTSALEEGEWSASRPGRFTPGERAPGTHLIGGWVGPLKHCWRQNNFEAFNWIFWPPKFNYVLNVQLKRILYVCVCVCDSPLCYTSNYSLVQELKKQLPQYFDHFSSRSPVKSIFIRVRDNNLHDAECT